ncbi:major facilitator superfamily domain-containing protein [Neurospora tetraspora]|uniref:Major facilitator superfamily domain-containing protein n=1 Tax=Neurospora tetraspora TaxID=94610 RepID=A0AAE0MRG0_9PEZI|nr:major facilitator superfamily domain-containing protein [Neurospora tetraspora]
MASSTTPGPSDPEKMDHQLHNIQPAPTISNNTNHDHDHNSEKPSAIPIEGESKNNTTAKQSSKQEEPELEQPNSPQQQQPDHDQNKTTWNASRTSISRFLLICYSFILMGMSDGAIGALIPYLETYYSISYTIVSLVFLSPFVGYLLAALFNNLIHHHFGQRGVAILGPFCRLIGFIPMACHPPYPALPVVMLFTGFGNGIEDSAWNAWVGNMRSANELLGIIHGCYGLGATIGPLIATSMVTKGGLEWYTFYYVMVGLNGSELVAMTAAFWTATKEVYRRGIAESESVGDVADVDADEEGGDAGGENEGGNQRTTTRTVMRDPIPWIVAMFLLGYVGAEVSLGGWIVTFMLKVRHAEPFNAGLTVTFFWLGLTVGRVVLGFITGRIGEKLAISGYLLLCIALQLLYWLVPSFVASAIFVSFLGFFLGPLFPAAIVSATKLLPPGYHVSAIGFAAAFGGGGAAIFPFAVGAIAQKKGVTVLQPIVLAILVFILLMWWLLPGGLKPGGLERARENKEKVGDEVRKGFSRWSFVYTESATEVNRL